MAHSIREIQARLIDLRRLAATAPDGTSNIDGRFGERSLDAYNHFRATLNKGPVVKADEAEVERDLWPEEQPPPAAPKPSIFDQLGTLLSLVQLLKGKTMTQDQINGILRAVLTTAGGYFVAHGFVSGALWDWISGGILTIGPMIWSWISNRPKTIVPIAAK